MNFRTQPHSTACNSFLITSCRLTLKSSMNVLMNFTHSTDFLTCAQIPRLEMLHDSRPVQLPRKSVAKFRDDFLPWEEMVLFWIDCRSWLSARGYNLNELNSYDRWIPPTHTTPASLPFAIRASDDKLTFPPVLPPVSEPPLGIPAVLNYVTESGGPCTGLSWTRCHDQAG